MNQFNKTTVARDPVGTPTPYLIHCEKDEDFGSCGQSTFLTEEQYQKQLKDANRGWRCPNCNCYPCEFDDKNFAERNQK